MAGSWGGGGDCGRGWRTVFREGIMAPMSDNAETAGRQRHSCLFYGCGVFLVLMLVVLAMIGLGYFQLRNFVNEFTSDAPIDLPPVSVSETQRPRLQARIDTFVQAVESGSPTQPLVLRSADLNALIVKNPNYEKYADRVRVSIDGDKINAQVSLPLKEFGMPLKDRYLNGMVSFKVLLEEGVLKVHAEEVTVDDKPLPDRYLGRLRQQNLAEAFTEGEDVREVIAKLEKIEVADGELRIVPKSPAASAGQ